MLFKARSVSLDIGTLVLLTGAFLACGGAATPGEAGDAGGGARIDVDGKTFLFPHVTGCSGPLGDAQMIIIEAVLDLNAPENGLLSVWGSPEHATIRIDSGNGAAGPVYDGVTPLSFDGKTLNWTGKVTRQEGGQSVADLAATVAVECP